MELGNHNHPLKRHTISSLGKIYIPFSLKNTKNTLTKEEQTMRKEKKLIFRIEFSSLSSSNYKI
jgi:hypothetical protein